MKKFICKRGASCYYLVNDGMGGFLNPPTHPEHAYSIQEFRGGHEVGSYSLSGARDAEYLPGRVKGTARGILKKWDRLKPVLPNESWMDSVYRHFKHCYSKDGLNTSASDAMYFGTFWNNADMEQDMPPAYHLGYLYVKQYYPEHVPDLARMERES